MVVSRMRWRFRALWAGFERSGRDARALFCCLCQCVRIFGCITYIYLKFFFWGVFGCFLGFFGFMVSDLFFLFCYGCFCYFC